jgi:hypothetical protein
VSTPSFECRNKESSVKEIWTPLESCTAPIIKMLPRLVSFLIPTESNFHSPTNGLESSFFLERNQLHDRKIMVTVATIATKILIFILQILNDDKICRPALMNSENEKM